jgi:fibronectin type 3 domain-containing protein
LNQTAQEVSAGAQTSIQIDGLQRGNTYYFYVEAFDANGQKVDAWQQVTAVLPSSGDLGGVHIPRMNASPQVLLTSPSANASFTAPATITLSATASDPDGVIQAVEFYSGSTRLASDSAAPYTFVWSSVAAGTYQLSAVALDSNGASARANVAITVKAAAPAAPTSLSGSAMETTVQLTWLHAGTDESGFRVYRSTGADYALVSTLAANSTEFTNTGLTPGVSYSYRVTAFNSGGESVPAQVSVTTRIHPPEAPSGIVASPVNEAIVIGWNASERATAYIVERSTTSSGPFAKIGTTQITQWTDSSVTPDTAYYYRVVASENGVLSAPSAIVSSLLPGSAPIAPTNLTSSVVKGGVTILWRDRSSNETGFQVERSLDGESFTLIATVEANVVTYTDNTVAPRRKYYYRVGAVNAAGTRFSSTMNVRTR